MAKRVKKVPVKKVDKLERMSSGKKMPMKKKGKNGC